MNIMIAADFGHHDGLLTPRKNREISNSTLDDNSQPFEGNLIQRGTVSSRP